MASLIERDAKRKAAEARQADRHSRDAVTQIHQLDLRLGKDVGARKERERLLRQLDANPPRSERRRDKVNRKKAGKK